MSSIPIPEKEARTLFASTELLEAARTRHRGLCYHMQPDTIAAARQEVHDALDALLDAQEALCTAQLRQWMEGRR